MTDLKTLLDPISRFVKGLDLSKPQAAEAALAKQFPAKSPAVAAIETAAKAALADGTLCDRGEPGMRFSRFAKPKDDPGGCSIDAVCMADAAGPVHTHLKGEVCLCFPLEGTPTFEGRSATWMVLPVGSRHVPTVKGGKMLILYWWPEGAVDWK